MAKLPGACRNGLRENKKIAGQVSFSLTVNKYILLDNYHVTVSNFLPSLN